VSVSGRAGQNKPLGASQGVVVLGATRAAALLLTIGLVLVAGACGREAQTLQPYTPSEGVNIDVGNPSDPNRLVQVRNLLIVSKTPGEGVLSATMVTGARDELTGVTGNAIKVDGSAGAPLTATLTSTVSFANGRVLVLTDGSPITLRSADLAPGLTANVKLQFRNAGEGTAVVPVVDGNEPQYASISPAPTPST